jgi:hypothetical protein
MTTIEDRPSTIDWRTAALVIAPAVLFGALVAHPYIEGRLPNDEAVAEEVAAGTTLWGVVHLTAAVASALIIVAFLAVRSYLHQAGEDRFTARGLPFIIVGSTLFAVLPGMEFVPLAAAETGATTAEIAAAQDAITAWFTAVLVASALTFGIGVLLFAAAISEVRPGSARLTRVVVGAMVVMAVSRFVPLAAAQFYAQGLAAVAALWPLAYAMRRQPVPSAA